jgi:hypothetical protein
LRIRAEDAEDLAVVSAAVQDAIVRVGDIVFEAKARRFRLLVNRFRWERLYRIGRKERVRAAIAVEGVLAVRSIGLARENLDALTVLLAVQFHPDPEPPGGRVEFVFAGAGRLALDVECLDVALVDLSASWATRSRPEHSGG